MSKVNYNHKAEGSIEACGQTQESLGALINKLNSVSKEVADKKGLNSEIIEKVAKTFTTDELSLILFLVNSGRENQSFSKEE